MLRGWGEGGVEAVMLRKAAGIIIIVHGLLKNLNKTRHELVCQADIS